MNDDLTPEMKEALKKLPRERMPMGLEARAVEAMRKRGFLPKRRRTIEMTGTRVASLLAACVALIIGAYSIGLYRGGGERFLPSATTVERADRGRTEAPVDAAPKAEPARARASRSIGVTAGDGESSEFGGADERSSTPAGSPKETAARDARLATGDVANQPRMADKQTIEVGRSEADAQSDLRKDQDVVAAPLTSAASPEETAAAERDARIELEEKPAKTENEYKRARQKAVSPPPSTPSPMATLPTARLQTQAMGEAIEATPNRSLTFLVNGSPVVVEAPDSVRVVQDERGRMLIIYTSDGIIRIRLAKDD